MRCPTCSSPLPDGAMFCGQCGRAITAADVAVFRAAQDAEKPVEPEALPGPAAWTLREPAAAAVPAGTPWWVAERDADADVESESASVPESQPEQEPESVPDSPPEPESVPDPEPQSPIEPGVEPEPGTVPEPAGAGSIPTPDLPTPDPVAPDPVVAPAAVERPAPVVPPRDTSRPASAPLWTASLAAIPQQDEPDAPLPDAEPAPEPQPTSLPIQASAPDPEPVASAPAPGDTNVIAPLVAPSAAASGGRLHCTVCGAALADSDIFCGECGTVVASVAQSFTGPITPILTGVVPSGEGDQAARSAEATDDVTADAPDAARDEATAPRPAPLAPTPIVAPALPPFIPDPEPAPRKRRLFGRKPQADSPQLWAGSTSPAAPDTPIAPMPPSVADGSAPGDKGPTDQGPTDRGPADQASTDPAARPAVRVAEVPGSSERAPSREASPAPLAATPVDAPTQTTPSVAPPVPPAPESPRLAAPWAAAALADDVENTRIVTRRPLGDAFTLQFSTGESFTVMGTGLVGRAPTPQPGESIDLLVRIIDPGKSVSKTHLEFGQEDGELWVSDRWSGNGTVVRPVTEAARRAEPGKRVRVARGARVEIGEQFFVVT